MAVVDEKELKRLRRRMFAKGANAGIVSPPVLGLPVKRTIPMNVHSVMDYQAAASAATAGMLAGGSAALAGSALGLAGLSVALLTDYKLSLAKLIPIEVHEVIDYVWGATAIAAPFLFGYAKKSPVATLAHIVLGATTIVASLFTDYRSAKGMHWSHSPTLPGAVGA